MAVLKKSSYLLELPLEMLTDEMISCLAFASEYQRRWSLGCGQGGTDWGRWFGDLVVAGEPTALVGLLSACLKLSVIKS